MHQNKKSKKTLLGMIIACACATCAGLFMLPFSPLYWKNMEVLQVMDGDGMERKATWLTNLEVNSRPEGGIVSTEEITFGWQMDSTEAGKYQTAYEINVADSLEKLGKDEVIWSSGKVESDTSAYIPYEGPELDPLTTYYWEVSVWDEKEQLVEQKEASFTTTIADSFWQEAKWISAPENSTTVNEIHHFQVDFDVQTDSTADFVWNAIDGEYGSHILWEVDAYGENLMYRLSFVDHKKVRANTEIELEMSSEICKDQMMHVAILVENDTIQTRLNGELIGDTAPLSEALGVSNVTLGTYGFYHGRTEEDSLYDNLKITDLDTNKVLCEDNFENASDTIFAPLLATVEEGRLKVRHQYLLSDIVETPAPIFEKVFSVKDGLEKAYLFGSSVGIYEPYLNGGKVGDRFYASGRQSYEQEIKYDAYDITESIQAGDNAIDVWLGHGWYDRTGSHTSGALGFCGQILLLYQDGTRDVICSDASWKCYVDGPIRNDDMYNGEFYDARKEIQLDVNAAMQHSEQGDSIEGWGSVIENCVNEELLEKPFVLNEMEPMRAIETVHPIQITVPKPGVFVYDFGKEVTGFVVLNGVAGKKGTVVSIQHGESIWTDSECGASVDSQSDNFVGTINDNSYLLAQCTNYYVCDSKPGDYAPKFADTAFRYVQIEGLSEALSLEQIEAVAISTDVAETGTFSSSDEGLNVLYENIVRSQRNNALDIPTDCPQRDERFGWAGDAQVFAQSAAYNADTYHFVENYLDYMREGQREDGAYPDIVQYDMTGYGENGWGDAGVTMTWYHYLQYGNPKIIEENYEAMCAYADYLIATSNDYIRSTGGYGDHDSLSGTPEDLMSTAQSANVCRLLSKMAAVIGNTVGEEHYLAEYHNYRAAFRNTFIAEDGSIECWSQTAYALALAYGLGAVDGQEELGEDLTEKLANNLSSCVSFSDNHLNTGYIGTKYLLPMLADANDIDQAYALLLQRTYPSWLYLVDKGATTIYERWESYLEHDDGTYELQGSLGHVALGSVCEFYYRYILGIESDEAYPGFKHFILQPKVDASLQSASGSYESIYGTIESSWSQSDTEITYYFRVPANTSATLDVPGLEKQELLSGEYVFTVTK